jgi:hypothetical protein
MQTSDSSSRLLLGYEFGVNNLEKDKHNMRYCVSTAKQAFMLQVHQPQQLPVSFLAFLLREQKF